MNQQKPRLLLYCQHSLGMGHWVRAITLANALSQAFDITFLNGGRAPGHAQFNTDLTVLDLPPLGMGEDHQLYSQSDQYSVDEALNVRRELILEAFHALRPDVVLIELFPFGRKKLAGELLPLLKAARRVTELKPLVLCSLRDIMVNARKDQLRHDERARWLSDRYFDGILVHADPRFARLEDSFKPKNPLKTPITYTGFVAPQGRQTTQNPERKGILVSAGGGMVGAPLFRAAIEAHRLTWPTRRLPMRLVTGPFLPEADWRHLQALAENQEGLTLLRSVPAMKLLLQTHQYSVSQCGYNTVMDILEAGTVSLVVPFIRGQEDEQRQRAEKLEALGLVKVLDPSLLNADSLTEAIAGLQQFRPNPSGLDLSGAQTTVVKICELIGRQTSPANTLQRSIRTEACAHV